MPEIVDEGSVRWLGRPREYELRADLPAILWEWSSGDTLQAVGDRHELTRERVRQLVDKHATDVHRARRESMRRERRVRKALEQMRPKQCPVCLRVSYQRYQRESDRFVTCGPVCAEKWPWIRRLADPEYARNHRVAVARWQLKHRKDLSENQRVGLEKVLDGTAPPPNRRWIQKGSHTHRVLESLPEHHPMRAWLIWVSVGRENHGTDN